VNAKNECQLVYRRSRSVASKNDHIGMLVRVSNTSVASLGDDLSRFLTEESRLLSTSTRRRVRVCVHREDIGLQVILNVTQ
jgi:hypothetical protein